MSPAVQARSVGAGDGFVGREFPYTRADFERVRSLIHARVGIALNDSKHNMVYNRLVKRLRALRYGSFAEYLALLDDPAQEEWQHFVNALTTNLSYFFRESYHFPILAEHAKSIARRPVRVWSAAASTGEEPYSIAITLCDVFSSLQPPAQVVATDIDTTVLQEAARGIYAMERVEPVGPQRLKRYFLRGTGSKEGFARVRPEVAALVDYRTLNLTDDVWKLEGPFDAVFCRNVMIYFDKPTQYRVLERIARVLAPDGLLFAGHSESFLHAGSLFRPAGKTVYRRAA
ncbi:MAG: methyltransferase domain-containing protein [Betaproteobacteria bacterium]|nr:methyltransferase domain-containing protein [Betaproteobacteria bacterium]